MNLPVKTGIKPKDSVIMRRRVLGVNVERKQTAFSAHQLASWKDGQGVFLGRPISLTASIVKN
jgi:hypothetical protein